MQRPRYRIRKRGAHYLTLDTLNSDLPSPAEIVAEIAYCVDNGADDLRKDLAIYIRAARKDGWRFSKRQ